MQVILKMKNKEKCDDRTTVKRSSGRHESGGENWSDGAADGKFLWNGYAHYRSDGKRKIEPEDMKLCGTILGTSGAAKLKEIQDNAMAMQPHHIPMLFMLDVINGFQTIFPIPLAQGCSFEPEIARKGAQIAAKEAAASGLHVTFAPMADLVRDARWGRVMESPGRIHI